jgi:hypothetical protein
VLSKKEDRDEKNIGGGGGIVPVSRRSFFNTNEPGSERRAELGRV